MVRLSPAGHLHVEGGPAPLLAATGEGAILWALAAMGGALPPELAFFRELARRFVATLCALADLEALRAEAALPPPEEDLAQLAAAAPPFPGAEYTSVAVLAALWERMLTAFRQGIAAYDGSVQAWLQEQCPAWNLLGRVCFHLAENRREPERPFAFLATYARRRRRWPR